MTEKHKLLITSTIMGLSALLGLSLVNNTNTANAAAGDKFMFIQVTDVADLHPDDIVIFANESYVINRLGGNPCFTYGMEVNNYTDNYSKFNFESTSAAMFKVEAGYTGGLSYYSFKCTRQESEETSSWLKTAGRYLAYAPNNSYNEDSINIQTKGDIIFKHAKDEYSSWNVDFDDDGFVYLSRANETNRFGHLPEPTEENPSPSPISVKWTSGYISDGYFGYFFGSANLCMYRRVNVRESNLHIYISREPDKTTYNAGEYTDLTGLELTITTQDTYMTFKSEYNDESSLFDALAVVYDENHSKGMFKWMGISVYFTATVYPNREAENNYLNTQVPYKDLRGTYILAAPYDGVTSILDLSQLTGEGEDHSGTSGRVTDLDDELSIICDSTYDEQGNRLVVSKVNDNVVTIVKEDDGYFIKVGSDYLAYDMTDYGYGLVYRGIKAHAKPITVDYNNNIRIDGKTLTCDKNLKKFYLSYVHGNEEQVELYRKVLKAENYSEIETFRSSFFSKTSTCDSTGDTNGLVLSNWQTLSSEFNALSLDSQAYIASLTYSHNQEDANSLKDMVDRYDLIVNKYSNSNFNDFMSRGAAGTLQVSHSTTGILSISKTNEILIVVTVVSITLMCATLVVLKKKRILG